MSGGLQFLSWVREGMAGELPGLANIDLPLPARGSVPVGVTVNNSSAAHLQARVHGPGDVTGIDPQQIIRAFPAPGTTDAETTSLAHLEFDSPDLPWLFTPGGPTAEGRLRPWLSLIVVPSASAEVRAATATSLAALTCQGSDLPDLADSWAWAHAQVTMSGPSASAARILKESPERTLSRIVSPRRLRPHNSYIAALVPSFEAGRRTGLGIDLGDQEHANLSPAWTGTGAVVLPLYHHWTFTTGAGGDFESLVRRLKARAMPDTVGMRPMSLAQAGAGLPEVAPGAPGSVLGLEGALRAPTALPTPWPDAVRAPWHAGMRALLAGSATRLTPPLYGGIHADKSTIPPPDGTPRWLRELNVDPRSRSAAAFGTRVIADHQEALAASAWEQAAAIQEANDQLRRAQLARTINTTIYRRIISAPDVDAGQVAQVAAPVAQNVTSGPRTSRTIAGDLAANPTVLAVTTAAFRRMSRPLGPMSRRLDASVPTGPTRTPSASGSPTGPGSAGPPRQTHGGSPGHQSSVGTTESLPPGARGFTEQPGALSPGMALAPGMTGLGARALSGGLLSAVATKEIAAVPALVSPRGMQGISSVISTSSSTFAVLGNVLAADQTWWIPGVYAPAPDLGGVPATVATDPSDAMSGDRLFVGSTDGRLFELRLVETAWQWRDHGKPPGPVGQTQGASVRDTPVVVDGQQRVFVTTKDGRLVQRHWTGDRWLWRDHGKPRGVNGSQVNITSAPVACGAAVFAVSAERVLVRLTWTANTSTWTSFGTPSSAPLVGNPGAAIGGGAVFIRTTAGRLAQLSRSGASWQWSYLPKPGDSPRVVAQLNANELAVALPFGRTVRVVTDPGAPMRAPAVFAGIRQVHPRTGLTWMARAVKSGGNWQWDVVTDATGPRPLVASEIDSAPGAAMMDSKCFARKSNNHLAEFVKDGDGRWITVDHGTPPERTLTGRPGGAIGNSVVHVRTTSGTLAARQWNGTTWVWADRGVPVDHGGDGGWNAAPPRPQNPDQTPNRNDSTWAAPIGFMSSLVVAHVDKAYGGDRVHHRVGRDIGLDGVARGGWTSPSVHPQGGTRKNTAGVGIALADLNGNGKLDMFVLTVAAGATSSTASYVIGWDLDAAGSPARWSSPVTLPDSLGANVQAVDVTLAPVAGAKRPNGKPLHDVVLAYVTGDGPAESDSHQVFYRIGWGLGATGMIVDGWSDSKDVPGARVGTVHGIGVLVGDLDDDTLPDILILLLEERPAKVGGAMVDHAYYRIGHRINRRGNVVGGWDAEQSMGGGAIWPRHSGLGIALADVSGSRRPDLVVFRIEDRDQDNLGFYRIGSDLDKAGVARSWSADIPIPGWYGWYGAGAAIAIGDLDPALGAARKQLAANYAAAAEALQSRINTAESLARRPSTKQVSLAPIADRLRVALNPEITVMARMLPNITVGQAALPAVAPAGTGAPGPGDPLRQLLAQVSFPAPAYELLRDISQQLILPGIEAAVPDTVTLVRANPGFIEAFLVGLNHEMSRELLWREFPADLRTTYFRQFWDTRSSVPRGTTTDIPPISSWRADAQLGDSVTDVGAGGEGHLVLLVRGEVLRRYPDATVTARRAVFRADRVGHDLAPGGSGGVTETLPIFTGSLSPDLLFFGFAMTSRQARGSSTDPGWFFMLREHASAPRFGVDEPPPDVATFGRAPTTTWRDLDWSALATDAAAMEAAQFVPVRTTPFAPVTLGGVTWARNGGHQATALLQLPVQMAIHASDMIPPTNDGWHVSAVSTGTDADPLNRISSLAGEHADGTQWELDIEQAIAAVERGEHFYVQLPGGKETRVVVSHTGAGRRYLRTVADDRRPNNLLALPRPSAGTDFKGPS